MTARSPLRLRLGLALFGLACAIAGLVGAAGAGHPGWAGLFGAFLLLAAADVALVRHRMRQGAHFQPGRDVPPYHPVRRPPLPRHREPP